MTCPACHWLHASLQAAVACVRGRGNTTIVGPQKEGPPLKNDTLGSVKSGTQPQPVVVDTGIDASACPGPLKRGRMNPAKRRQAVKERALSWLRGEK